MPTKRQSKYMLLVWFWALPNFVTFVSFFLYSHDREPHTHYLHLLKLPHWKGSISILSTYFLLCSTFYKVSPKFFPNKGITCASKKNDEGTWRPMNVKKLLYGHMKVHANTRWLAMPKITRRERPYMEHLILASHFIHHTSTHMHFSIMVVWLVYSFGFIFGFAKYLKQVCFTLFPTMSST